MEKKGKQKRLSIAELKSFKGFDDYTDQQAEEAIATLEKFSILLFELYQKRKALIEKSKIDPDSTDNIVLESDASGILPAPNSNNTDNSTLNSSSGNPSTHIYKDNSKPSSHDSNERDAA